MKVKHKGILIVVSGFSGAGKGTLMKQLVHSYENYALSVSMTTRAPRPGEEEGKEYFFVTREEFEEKIRQDGLVEYASYCDNYYGTPREYVEKQLEKGKDVILEIEIQGALKIKNKFPTALLMFVMPPSVSELRRRLEGRGTESPEVIAKRLKRAAEEAEGIEEYDFIVINDKLEECAARMHELIRAAHDAPIRNKELIENMREELEAIC
ncbi:guanylate kinase [Lachnospiraceae bacterium]|mgnify:CR=1 FL=1|jgi:guanylate kinase|nr:guanylate kinase [Lachnospiraceae bacterium]NBH24574.1 guanylate kinase [Lachnospiraceae bacterium]GFI17526.1 guanylate kinase [Lachnospiraceae bacterium]GFI69437.1 guanylate kinase [Lachnospiraceae bacterium]